MNTVWRLVHPRYADPRQAFSGAGARRYGGRWNLPGVAVVYTSEHLSLAVLELLVHFGAEGLKRVYCAFPVEIPADLAVTHLEIEALPPSWREYPPPVEVQRLGTDWAQRGDTAVLVVPSVLVPEERNVLLNPNHPDFARLRIGPARAFALDPRLLQSTGRDAGRFGHFRPIDVT